jgi:hypothetical protein
MHGIEGDKTSSGGGVVDLTSGVIEEMKAAARTAGLRHFEVRCNAMCGRVVLHSFTYHSKSIGGTLVVYVVCIPACL